MSESVALLLFTLAFIAFWLIAMTDGLSGLRDDWTKESGSNDGSS